MKNIKKISVIIISAILIIIGMNGCTKNEKQDNTTTIPSTSDITTTQPVVSTTEPTTTQPITSTTAPTTTEPTTSAIPSTTEYIPPVTETTVSVTPAINYPLINENDGFNLTLNADGTFTHEGVYNMDLSNIGIRTPLPINIKTTGNVVVSGGSVTLSNTKMIMNCTDEAVNSLSGVAKIAAKALKNVELTDKSTAAINNGQLTFSFVGSNGSADYTLSTHTLSADQTSALLSH